MRWIRREAEDMAVLVGDRAQFQERLIDSRRAIERYSGLRDSDDRELPGAARTI